MHIYIVKNGTKTGPYSEEQVRGMLTGGLVSVDDSAWCEGAVDWQPLHALLGLKQPPPIPTAAQPLATPPAIAAQPVGPTGVGGWLAFFCVALTILSPLFALVSMANNWSQSEPPFGEFPILKTVLLWENFGSIGLLIYGFIVGCIVWSGNPRGRSIARQFLLIRLFGFIGVELIALLMMSGLPSEVVADGVGGVVVAVFTVVFQFLIWWFYFKKSKRVRNTYGDERALKAQGIRVGFMGARKEDLDKINANTAIAPGGSYTVALKNAVPSTDQGDAEAQFNLGWRYANGLGVPKDEDEVVKRVRKAADQGDANGQVNLGVMYEYGQGVAKDEGEAVKWYRKAADQGDANGQVNLGLMYKYGQGVAKDEVEAVKWFRKAADQGEAMAQNSLGNCYFFGRGVANDEVEACKWYLLAAAQGHEHAKENFGILETRMTSTQRAEGQKRS